MLFTAALMHPTTWANSRRGYTVASSPSSPAFFGGYAKKSGKLGMLAHVRDVRVDAN